MLSMWTFVCLFVCWLFTNFLQGVCITFVIKENKTLSTHSPVFGTGIGGIPFLCPRLKLQMYLLVSRLIIRGGGGGRGMQGPRHLYQPWRNHSQCEGCAIAMATPPHGHTGHMYVPTRSRPASGRTRRRRWSAKPQLPRHRFSCPVYFLHIWGHLLYSYQQRLRGWTLPAREALVEALTRRPLAMSISGVLSLLGRGGCSAKHGGTQDWRGFHSSQLPRVGPTLSQGQLFPIWKWREPLTRGSFSWEVELPLSRSRRSTLLFSACWPSGLGVKGLGGRPSQTTSILGPERKRTQLVTLGSAQRIPSPAGLQRPREVRSLTFPNAHLRTVCSPVFMALDIIEKKKKKKATCKLGW